MLTVRVDERSIQRYTFHAHTYMKFLEEIGLDRPLGRLTVTIDAGPEPTRVAPPFHDERNCIIHLGEPEIYIWIDLAQSCTAELDQRLRHQTGHQWQRYKGVPNNLTLEEHADAFAKCYAHWSFFSPTTLGEIQSKRSTLDILLDLMWGSLY